nr:MAG TPA: hypothetical protein [Caudoviricetes sp.]
MTPRAKELISKTLLIFIFSSKLMSLFMRGG